MSPHFFVKKIAVLGAGVMGAQIAAQCANAGFETLLFDLNNGLVLRAKAHLNQLKPSPLATAQTVALIQARHYEAHLAELSTCDLIIEAIAERMDWKEDLYKKIAPHLTPFSVLVSNTSGLGINALCKTLPQTHRSRFCGVHFFNR
jgi:3-hydroxyacyl-CoA dehydrogenase